MAAVGWAKIEALPAGKAKCGVSHCDANRFTIWACRYTSKRDGCLQKKYEGGGLIANTGENDEIDFGGWKPQVHRGSKMGSMWSDRSPSFVRCCELVRVLHGPFSLRSKAQRESLR